MASWFLRGLMIAVIFGLPAGAIGALTIQRTLRSGFGTGFVTGLGSTAADVLYASAGVFGVTLVSGFLTAHQRVIGTVSGGLILLMGLVVILKKENGSVATAPSAATRWKAFLTSFALAIVNPAVIASFFTAFAAFGITEIPNTASGVLLVMGIGMGTACWWAALAGITAWLKTRISPSLLHKCGKALGLVMIGFGVYTLIRFLV